MSEKNVTKLPERVDWERNHTLVIESFNKLWEKNKKFPSAKMISDDCGLSYKTVKGHIKAFSFTKGREKYKLAFDRNMNNLQRACDNQDVRALKYYNEIVFDKYSRSEITGKDGEPIVTSVEIILRKDESEI